MRGSGAKIAPLLFSLQNFDKIKWKLCKKYGTITVL